MLSDDTLQLRLWNLGLSFGCECFRTLEFRILVEVSGAVLVASSRHISLG